MALEVYTNIDNLKKLGMMQKTYMFSVSLPFIPSIGPSLEISYLVKNVSVPAKSRDVEIIYTLADVFTLPKKPIFQHEITMSIMLTENAINFVKLVNWFNLIDSVPLEIMKARAAITLLNLDRQPTSNIFILNGLYPKRKFGLENLSMDNVDGYVTYDQMFAFDDIQLATEVQLL